MSILSELAKVLLELLYPRTCFFCTSNGSYICGACESKKFTHFKKCKCHICHGQLRTSTQFIHKICKRKSSLDGVFSTYILDKNFKKYLYAIKYKFESELLIDLKRFYKPTISNIPISYDLITFVPADTHRNHWRDFNQAELIAKNISWKVSPLLIKTAKTSQQAKLHKKDRKKNLKKIFKIFPGITINGKTILICDDVYTTGSTLEACAFVLKKNGAKRVYAYTLALDELPGDIPSQIE